jgi:hypothetical protein
MPKVPLSNLIYVLRSRWQEVKNLLHSKISQMHGQRKGSLPKAQNQGLQQRITTMAGGTQAPRKMTAMTMMRRKRKRRRPTGMGTLTIKTIIIPSRLQLGQGVIMEMHRELITTTLSAPGSPSRILSNSNAKSTRSRCN